MMTNKNRKSNSLIHESSPYLLQHACNPVYWHPWNSETLAKAKQLDKPLLVSIGYSTCHWCHVMAEESFEDDEVAQLMNENFICIKIDREERPDVDQMYMDAVQMMTGAGGWPLNCFALPDGTPFFGGTYFRKEEWLDVLRRIGDLRRSNPTELASYGAEVLSALKQNDQRFLSNNTSITKKDADLLRDKLLETSDKTNGGQKGAPKFPLPSVLLTELELAHHTNNQALRQHLELTLMRMASGGIYDQVGGGFARYAVDKHWKVPHFEKMLYDNAQLLSVYSKAYKLNPQKTYKRIVYETIDFLSHELESKSGAFYSALDADSEGEEGAFYVWRSEEFDKVLGPYSTLIKKYYGVDENGNWEGKKNILVCTENKSTFARQENLSQAELDSLLQSARKKLNAYRNGRTKPGLDNKIIASWNALVLEGLTDAYTAFNKPAFLKKAQALARYLEQNHLTNSGEVIRLTKNKGNNVPGFLDDYANLGNAFLKLYSISSEERFFEYAKTIAQSAYDKFFDNQSGLFFYSEDDEELPQKQKDIHDNVMPSSNASMMRLLYNVGMLTHQLQYLDVSRKALASLLPGISQSVVAYSAWSRLLMTHYFGSYVLAVTGPKAAEKLKALHSQLVPNALVIGSSDESDIPVLQNRHSASTTRIFVCDEKSCLSPVEKPEEAIEMTKKKPEQ